MRSKSNPQAEFPFISLLFKSNSYGTHHSGGAKPGGNISKNSDFLSVSEWSSGLPNLLPNGLEFQRFCVPLMEIRCYSLCFHSPCSQGSLSLQSPSGWEQTGFILICLKIIFNAINVVGCCNGCLPSSFSP